MYFLFLRVFAGPLANVSQKRLVSKGVNVRIVVFATYLLISACMLPSVFFFPWRTVNPQFWFWIAGASLIDLAGNIFQVKSLQTVELSVYGPINAFKPIAAMGIALFIAHEIPTRYGLAGMLVIIAGSLLLARGEARRAAPLAKTLVASKGIIYRIIGILLSAAAAVMIKKSLGYASAESVLFFWACISLPVLALDIAWTLRSSLADNIARLAAHRRDGFLAALFFFVMQYLTTLSFQRTFVGYSLAVFQLSAIVSIFLGKRHFQEKGILRKSASALVMILGALLIVWGR